MEIKFRLRDSDHWEEYDGGGAVILAVLWCIPLIVLFIRLFT